MFDACRNAGVVLAVGHNRRFWPSMRALREIAASGELGTILHVEGHNSNENSESVTEGWRLSPEESPGGGLTGAGLHVLDGFVSLLGPARQVYARFIARGRTAAARYGHARDRLRERRHRDAGDGAGHAVLLARSRVRHQGIGRGARRDHDGAAKIRQRAADPELSERRQCCSPPNWMPLPMRSRTSGLFRCRRATCWRRCRPSRRRCVDAESGHPVDLP